MTTHTSTQPTGFRLGWGTWALLMAVLVLVLIAAAFYLR